MSESPSRLVRTANPTRPAVPARKISGKAPPIRIFEQNYLEVFTLISFRTFIIFCLLYEITLFSIVIRYNLSLGRAILYGILGLPVWFLFEYALHRFIFHFASEKRIIKRLVYIFHGNHHIQPNHPCRTLMPIIVTLPVSLLIWWLFSSMLGFGLGSALFLGFFTGYVFYDCMHFATHNFRMKTFPLSIWKRHHLLHHHLTEEHNYSISLPWLDILFRTHFKR